MRAEITRVVAHFNDHAAQYAQEWNAIDRVALHRDWLRALDNRMAEKWYQTQRRLDALDIGAGSLADAFMLATRGCHVVAVEPAQKLLTQGRQHFSHPEIGTIRDDLPLLHKVRALKKSFDIILANDVWSYLPTAAWHGALRTVRDLAAPGGIVMLSYPASGTPPLQRDVDVQALSDDIALVNSEGPRKLFIHSLTKREPSPETPTEQWRVRLQRGGPTTTF